MLTAHRAWAQMLTAHHAWAIPADAMHAGISDHCRANADSYRAMPFPKIGSKLTSHTSCASESMCLPGAAGVPDLTGIAMACSIDKLMCPRPCKTSLLGSLQQYSPQSEEQLPGVGAKQGPAPF